MLFVCGSPVCVCVCRCWLSGQALLTSCEFILVSHSHTNTLANAIFQHRQRNTTMRRKQKKKYIEGKEIFSKIKCEYIKWITIKALIFLCVFQQLQQQQQQQNFLKPFCAIERHWLDAIRFLRDNDCGIRENPYYALHMRIRIIIICWCTAHIYVVVRCIRVLERAY